MIGIFMRISSLFHIAILAGLSCPALAEGEKDFTIIIDGNAVEINAGETVTTKSKSGAPIQIELKRNEFSTHSEEPFSFQHRSDLSISATDVSEGIRQILMTSALGSMTIVQTYKDVDPKSMAQFMLDQLTGDDAKAGAKVESKPTTRILSDGTEMKGLTATVKLRSSSEVKYEVVTLTVGDGGIIAISRIDDEFVQGDQAIIDRFWTTLKINKPTL
jgi:hypothetical protein